jgi:hypothetical protein
MTLLANSSIRDHKLSPLNITVTMLKKNIDLSQFINLFKTYNEIKQHLPKRYRNVLLPGRRQQTAEGKVLTLQIRQRMCHHLRATGVPRVPLCNGILAET